MDPDAIRLARETLDLQHRMLKIGRTFGVGVGPTRILPLMEVGMPLTKLVAMAFLGATVCSAGAPLFAQTRVALINRRGAPVAASTDPAAYRLPVAHVRSEERRVGRDRRERAAGGQSKGEAPQRGTGR